MVCSGRRVPWMIAVVVACGIVSAESVAAASEFEARVVDDGGEPVAGAEVTFLEWNEERTTDDEGWVRVEATFGGEQTILVEVEGMEPTWAEIDVDADAPGRRTLTVGADDEIDEQVVGDDESESEAEDDEAIFVETTTASPLENPVDYQPLEILDGDDLQRRSANSYGQMLDGSPGVTARSFGPAPSRPVIRGLGGERVLVLQNGERTGDVSSTAHDHHISVDPLEADRVEIVRGPASLLYGSSALGGVVNIMDERIPRSWDDGLFSEVSLYGGAGQMTGAGAATGGYGFDSSAVRARASHRQAGDMRTPDGMIPDTGIRGTTADIGASTETDRGLFGASAGFQDLDFGLPEDVDDPDESVELQSRRFFAQTHAERDLSGFFEYLEWRLLANRYDHEEIETEFGPGGDVVDRDLELAYDIWAASSTLTAQHGDVGPFERGAVGTQVRFRDLQLAGDEVLSPDAREGSVAVFLFEEAAITDRIHLQLGVRPELDIMQPRANDEFDAPDDTRISPTLAASTGLHLEATDRLEFGVQLARAHRAPIVEELYSDAPHLGTGQYEIGNPDLGHEIGYGGDLYTRWSGAVIDAELSGFVNHIDDFIFLSPTGDIDGASDYPIFEYESADARLVGGELSLTARPWRSLEFGTVVDYVRGQRLSPNLQDLPEMPPLRGRVEFGWNGPEYWAMTGLRTAAGQDRTAPDEAATDGYALVDLEAGLRLMDVGVGVHKLGGRLDNAFDTAYRDHLSRVRGLASPMPGRSLHATYRWIY